MGHGTAVPSESLRWGYLVVIGVAFASLGLCGCTGFWEEVTSNDKDFARLIWPPDPLVVLRDSNDGDRRAEAYAALREPKAHGGTDAAQDFMVDLLNEAAKTEPHVYTRMIVVQKMAEFEDPRIVKGLIDAYYEAQDFRAEKANENRLRCAVVTALGEVKHPSAVDFLVRVVKQGPVEGTEEDRQMALDERMAAARALKNYPQVQAAEALVDVLKNDKDIALRTCAHKSLQVCTGESLPMEADAWANLLQQQQASTTGVVQKKTGLMDLILTGFTGDE